jgi:homogentisate 1,2-dioxygenase
MAERRPISLPQIKGIASRQAHADLPPGTFEREMSKEGFFGPAAFFHHRHPPTGWSDFQGPLAPHAFDLTRIEATPDCPWAAPLLLSNDALEIRLWKLAAAQPALARNADGDQLLFIHQGAAELFCDFGHLSLARGDYLVLPRGTMWRLEPSAAMTILLIEASGGGYALPDKGMMGNHAIFDAAMLDSPDIDQPFLDQQSDQRATDVRIKAQGAISVATFPFNPLDAIGWHGDLCPVRINVAAIRPLMSHRFHVPPSAHTTFVAPRFVVCTFTPRPFETDPGALKVPFFHNNDDYDEVLFYHDGDFFSRDNIRPGMMTLHPSGFTHGPHPKALSRMLVQSKAGTDEVAVMIDSRDSLTIGAAAHDVEIAGYVDSWKPQT